MVERALSDALLVGVDFSNGEDVGGLIVGRKTDHGVDVLNAFKGPEAWALYQRLVGKNTSANGEEN